MGRYALPTQVKKAKGTLEKSREGNSIGLRADSLAVIPEPPTGLLKTGREYWSIYCRDMVAWRVLSESDLPGLEMLCKLHDVADKLYKKLKRSDLILEGKDKDGNKTTRLAAELKGYTQLTRDIAALASMYGFNPAARSRIKVEAEQGPEKTDDGFEF